MTSNKWGKAFWRDTGERVGTTAIYGVITFLTLGGTTSADYDQIWPVIALPSVLSLLKALLVNLGGSTDSPTASLVGVKSKSAPGA